MLGKYRATTLDYLRNYNDPIYSTVEEQGKVLQSGLALTPMAWAHTRNTVDWVIAWALIGERASKELFPPPLHGNWPKHGHGLQKIAPLCRSTASRETLPHLLRLAAYGSGRQEVDMMRRSMEGCGLPPIQRLRELLREEWKPVNCLECDDAVKKWPLYVINGGMQAAEPPCTDFLMTLGQTSHRQVLAQRTPQRDCWPA